MNFVHSAYNELQRDSFTRRHRHENLGRRRHAIKLESFNRYKQKICPHLHTERTNITAQKHELKYVSREFGEYAHDYFSLFVENCSKWEWEQNDAHEMNRSENCNNKRNCFFFWSFEMIGWLCVRALASHSFVPHLFGLILSRL